MSGKNQITSKKFKFEDYGSALVVRCPRCDSEYLHHTGAVFFDRVEDGPSAVKIDVRGPATKTAVIPSEGSGNPSSRRHGMKVLFECENCLGEGDSTIELNIAQHKGSTQLSWTFSPRIQRPGG